jgi:hypothetical protein
MHVFVADAMVMLKFISGEKNLQFRILLLDQNLGFIDL